MSEVASSRLQHASKYFVIGLIFISFPLQLLEARRSGHVDGTLTPGFSGVNVVIAVLEKIDASEVFEDSEWFRRNRDSAKSFLRRMAYVESKDGRVNRTGGIWNIISEDELRKTQIYANRTTLRQSIRRSPFLGFDWMDIKFNATMNNLSIPLYSGLATVIRLDKIFKLEDNSVRFSSNLNDQLQLWRGHLNGTNDARDRWQKTEHHLTRYENCTIKTDVVFVIDASNSISESNLAQAKRMMYNFTKELSISNGYNKIGIVLIRSTAFVYHRLSEHLNKTYLLQKIDELPYVRNEYTNTADGLCQMSKQAWRDDQSVLHLAVVLTDGGSNDISNDCEGGTEHVANLIHTNHSHILVIAVGIGDQIDVNELSLIASGRHLVVELEQYKQAMGVPASLHYQICYTLSEPIIDSEENRTVLMERDQIMRWIRSGVGGDGVTIRLCVRRGKITLYVSSLPNPSEAMNDIQETIAPENTIAISCSTYFIHPTPIRRRTRRNQVIETSAGTIYITVLGQDNSSLVSLQTANGNVTFDVNECEQDPYPCHESATCYNTDGSFYCECQEGFNGDGFECRGHSLVYTNNDQFVVILPSSILSVIISFSLFALLVSIVTWRKCKKRKSTYTPSAQLPQFRQSEIMLVKANLKKVGNTFSATNATT